MAEISKGVWVPRTVVKVPTEEDDCETGDGRLSWPKVYLGLPRRAAGVMNPEDESDDEAARPLEPVAAYTYEEARKMGEAPALAPAPAGEDGYYSRTLAEAYRTGRPMAPEPERAMSAMEKAFKGRPDAFEAYSEAEWNEVPETERPKPFITAWYNCVKKYRFIKYGGPLGGQKLIIELELMSGTTLRHIVKLSQVKGVLTKSSVRDTGRFVRIEEVIIDIRPHNEYAPEQLKLRFAGSTSALAFQMDLMSAL